MWREIFASGSFLLEIFRFSAGCFFALGAILVLRRKTLYNGEVHIGRAKTASKELKEKENGSLPYFDR